MTDCGQQRCLQKERTYICAHYNSSHISSVSFCNKIYRAVGSSVDVSRTVCFWLITQQVGMERQIQIASGADERTRELAREQWRKRCRVGDCVSSALEKCKRGTFRRAWGVQMVRQRTDVDKFAIDNPINPPSPPPLHSSANKSMHCCHAPVFANHRLLPLF